MVDKKIRVRFFSDDLFPVPKSRYFPFDPINYGEWALVVIKKNGGKLEAFLTLSAMQIRVKFTYYRMRLTLFCLIESRSE